MFVIDGGAICKITDTGIEDDHIVGEDDESDDYDYGNV